MSFRFSYPPGPSRYFYQPQLPGVSFYTIQNRPSLLSEPLASRSRPIDRRAPCFDQYLHEDFFPRLSKGETKLNDALMARYQSISQSGSEFKAVSGLVSEVKQALETIVAIGSMPEVQIEEYRLVGSLKKDTLINKSNIAEMVVIFNNPPKHDDLVKLGENIVRQLQARVTDQQVTVVKEDYGVAISADKASVRLMPALADNNAELDETVHMKRGFFLRNKQTLKQAYWFDDNCINPTIRILVRLVKDIRRRSRGLMDLNMWAIDVLSHYCVTHTSTGGPLPLTHAFRRFFSLLSAGIFLHTSLSLTDPCDKTHFLNEGYSPQEADNICRASQMVMRLLFHERYSRLLGQKNSDKDLCSENDYADKLNIAPVKEAYNEEVIVNDPGEKFTSTEFKYPPSQPAYYCTPPSSPKKNPPSSMPKKPLPNPNEFKEFYNSIQVITSSSRSSTDKRSTKQTGRNSVYKPY